MEGQAYATPSKARLPETTRRQVYALRSKLQKSQNEANFDANPNQRKPLNHILGGLISTP
jgi:hypothetical protein